MSDTILIQRVDEVYRVEIGGVVRYVPSMERASEFWDQMRSDGIAVVRLIDEVGKCPTKIRAIMAVRETLRLPLKEAKEWVESRFPEGHFKRPREDIRTEEDEGRDRAALAIRVEGE